MVLFSAKRDIIKNTKNIVQSAFVVLNVVLYFPVFLTMPPIIRSEHNPAMTPHPIALEISERSNPNGVTIYSI